MINHNDFLLKIKPNKIDNKISNQLILSKLIFNKAYII